MGMFFTPKSYRSISDFRDLQYAYMKAPSTVFVRITSFFSGGDLMRNRLGIPLP